MKITAKAILLVLAILSANGCVYDHGVSSEHASLIDERLLGTWILNESEGQEEQMNIRKASDKTYEVDYAKMLFEAFIVNIEGVPVVSLKWKNKEEDDSPYTFATYKIEDTRITVKIINDEIIDNKTINDAQDMYEAIRANINNMSLFHTPGTFEKKPSNKAL